MVFLSLLRFVRYGTVFSSLFFSVFYGVINIIDYVAKAVCSSCAVNEPLLYKKVHCTPASLIDKIISLSNTENMLSFL